LTDVELGGFPEPGVDPDPTKNVIKKVKKLKTIGHFSGN
jgi:hypothetical protein